MRALGVVSIHFPWAYILYLVSTYLVDDVGLLIQQTSVLCSIHLFHRNLLRLVFSDRDKLWLN